MADILYQPGVPGGGTLTTQIGAAPQLGGQAPAGFDMSWLQQLAARKAAREDQERRMAQQAMKRQEADRDWQMRQQANDRAYGRMSQERAYRDGQDRQVREDQMNTEEIWVDSTTGQPSQPWLPNAMPTHRKYVPKQGSISHGAGAGESSMEFGPERWAAENQKRPVEAESFNPGRGGIYTRATGRGGY